MPDFLAGAPSVGMERNKDTAVMHCMYKPWTFLLCPPSCSPEAILISYTLDHDF